MGDLLTIPWLKPGSLMLGSFYGECPECGRLVTAVDVVIARSEGPLDHRTSPVPIPSGWRLDGFQLAPCGHTAKEGHLTMHIGREDKWEWSDGG